MAVTVGNIQFGFKVGGASVVTLAATDVGFIEGGVAVRLPREYAFLNSDMYPVDFAHVMTKKDMMVSFQTSEISQVNIQSAWDNDAPAGGVLTQDDDFLGEVALIVNTTPPTGSSTRVISIPKAVAIGEGLYNIPANAKQTIDLEFKAIGNSASAGLLGTITDA